MAADSSKFAKIALYNVCDLKDIDKIVTDKKISEGMLHQFNEMQIEVVLA